MLSARRLLLSASQSARQPAAHKLVCPPAAMWRHDRRTAALSPLVALIALATLARCGGAAAAAAAAAPVAHGLLKTSTETRTSTSGGDDVVGMSFSLLVRRGRDGSARWVRRGAHAGRCSLAETGPTDTNRHMAGSSLSTRGTTFGQVARTY